MRTLGVKLFGVLEYGNMHNVRSYIHHDQSLIVQD